MATVFFPEDKAEFEAMVDAAVQKAIEKRAPAEFPSEPLLTVEQLAEKLQLQPKFIYEQSRLGKLPYIRCGRYLRFNLQQVIKHFTQRKGKKSEKE